MRNVLCASDLSEAAAEAIAEAAAIAARDGARLLVLHVLPAPVAVAAEAPVAIVDETQSSAAAGEALEQQLARISAARSASREVIRQAGSIATDILQRAEAMGADLVVVASHRRSAVERVLLGSTAGEVVRRARRPVLVVRRGGRSGTVLAATDLSDASLPAIRAAASEAGQRGAQLLVIHCLDLPPSSVGLGGMGVVPAPPEDATSAHARVGVAEKELSAFLDRANVRAEARVAPGAAASSIVALAEKIAPELVVVGTSGKSGLKRLVLGSVAEAVVGKAPGSVLIVPAA